jgi:signal transduction histidine kinase
MERAWQPARRHVCIGLGPQSKVEFAMRFSVFIEENLDAIVAEWETFARTLLPAAKTLSGLALRDHCREILLAVVRDMETSQTEDERAAKSKQVALAPAASATIAAAHGAMRHLAGFELAQMVSEFRAMRASVLSLWRQSAESSTIAQAIEEIARFNEAIDQALGESVSRYSDDVTTFVSVIGHDLQGPLRAIEGSSEMLAKSEVEEKTRQEFLRRIGRSSRLMGHLIADLLEYARTGLTRGIAVARSPCDLRVACEEAVDVIQGIYPQLKFAQELSGDLQINADPPRIQQVLLNMLSTAVLHGDRNSIVSLNARGDADAVVLTVVSFGRPIPADVLQVLFEPLVRVPLAIPEPHMQPYTSLGLGLFIVRKIVIAHHGKITVDSSPATGTVFTIRLPRK